MSKEPNPYARVMWEGFTVGEPNPAEYWNLSDSYRERCDRSAQAVIAAYEADRSKDQDRQPRRAVTLRTQLRGDVRLMATSWDRPRADKDTLDVYDGSRQVASVRYADITEDAAVIEPEKPAFYGQLLTARRALEAIARAAQGSIDSSLPLDREWVVCEALRGLGEDARRDVTADDEDDAEFLADAASLDSDFEDDL